MPLLLKPQRENERERNLSSIDGRSFLKRLYRKAKRGVHGYGRILRRCNGRGPSVVNEYVDVYLYEM